MDIKNIIFDFGGVLINLDISKTEAAFRALMGGAAPQAAAYKQLMENNIFTDYEIGAITTEQFIAALQAANPIPTTPDQIQTAWNAMLLNFPPKRIELLKELKAAGYGVYLLSNINDIHLTTVRKIIEKKLGITDYDALFDEVFYSHLIGHRKPHKATYDYVLKEADLAAHESVFIDDTAANLVGARQAGLHTIHHEANTNINKRLKAYLNM